MRNQMVGNSRHYQVLAGGLIMTIVAGSVLMLSPKMRGAGMLSTLPVIDDWHESIQVATANPANMSIWSNEPMLGDVPGQSYYGHVVVEVWDEGEFATHTTYPDEPGKTAYLLKHAILALQSNDTPVLTTTPWSDDEPVLEPAPPDQAFHGRVVVEVWDSQATVAITGPGQPSDLAERAVQELLQIMRIRR